MFTNLPYLGHYEFFINNNNNRFNIIKFYIFFWICKKRYNNSLHFCRIFSECKTIKSYNYRLITFYNNGAIRFIYNYIENKSILINTILYSNINDSGVDLDKKFTRIIHNK
jgi:hypothetical protein